MTSSQPRTSTRKKNPLSGKTIAKIKETYDGAQLLDLELFFTDGSSASFMAKIEPNYEVTFFADDGPGKKVKL